MLALYENIKNRRIELNMTQEELADKMGYQGKSMISKIEKGLVDLSQSKILAFAKALNTTPSALMGWTDYEQAGRTLAAKLIDRRLNDACKKAFDFTEDDKQMIVDFINRLDSGRIIPD